MILRFMGDLPEPKLPEVPDQKDQSLGKRLRESIGKKFGSQIAAVSSFRIQSVHTSQAIQMMFLFFFCQRQLEQQMRNKRRAFESVC